MGYRKILALCAFGVACAASATASSQQLVKAIREHQLLRGSPLNILVVDDSTVMRNIMVTVLKQNGYGNIKEASNGAEALEQVDSSLSLIITDVNMPVMDGFQFVKEVKARDDLKNIPIIAVSTDSDQEHRMLKLGVFGDIAKPFAPEEFMNKIKLAIGD